MAFKAIPSSSSASALCLVNRKKKKCMTSCGLNGSIDVIDNQTKPKMYFDGMLKLNFFELFEIFFNFSHF